MSSRQYQPLPQHEVDIEKLNLKASELEQPETPQRGSGRFTWKRLLVLLAAAAVFQGTYFAIQHATRPAPRRVRLGIPCRGSHYNSSVASLPTHYTLPSGDKIPSVALGVWQATPNEVGEAVKAALKTGYRHIDDAWVYQNEEEVGQALRESGVPREQVWLTSKLAGPFHAPEDVEWALDDSLRKLGVDYLDLYLIHFPIAVKKGTADEVDEALTANPYPTWKKLEEMVDKGKVRNIGVSNFNIVRLRNLTANPLKYQPAVNQVELSYWNPQPDLLKWSKDNGLLLEAYSPLGGGALVKDTLNLPVVQEISRALSITPAQVIISWHVQRGTVVLPKSVTPSRVEENYLIYKLPETLFDKLEKAAASHPPRRVVNPSKRYKLPYDIFDDDGGVIVPDDSQ
ncbi:NADP-dependent oxidoreductase domain-containing protein [Daedaleopsis nitida]|nr:NADP-dependent oxidoreductase domain-containing protein [Daedaleopsis nitida]